MALNDLQLALLGDDLSLDDYLKQTETHVVRLHIEDIKRQAAGSTEAGLIKRRLIELI